MMMKKLCRIRLINWHYFADETINVSGSFLISGENTAGKSTVLDAIQLVLTTNNRKFNTAANEKSSRDLKGYVRCKTGNENNTYLRGGSVITYVALEFYEERTAKYFTLGVKIDSPDEESRLTTKWFREECKLEELSFLTDNRPSTTEQFRKNDKKVQLISQISEAKARFGQRMGNLENRFFDMIPKSLAFKPMDNVKDFINKFILSEKSIEVATLRNNIATLKEFEDLMNTTKEKISKLKVILSKNDEIILKEREIKTNEILIKKAELEAKKLECQKLEKENYILNQDLINEQNNEKTLKTALDNERERFTNLQIACGQNETTQLIKDTKNNIKSLEKDKERSYESYKKLQDMLSKVNDALNLLSKYQIYIISKEELSKLSILDLEIQQKTEIILELKKHIEELLEEYRSNKFRVEASIEEDQNTKMNLENEIKNLKNKKLTYPENTIKLKEAIEKEFVDQEIRSEVRIFSDLLEVVDSKWQDAVEGYLNSQRFYIIVDPRYYNAASQVYNKIKKEVHTVGLVNTDKLHINKEVDKDSLAYVVKSDNRFAKAYAVYLLNNVKRAYDVQDLKNHNVAITADCMLYKNHAVRKIDERVYKTPFIGAFAFEIQLRNKEQELLKLKEDIKAASSKLDQCKGIIDKLIVCNIELIIENINAPKELDELKDSIYKEKLELKKAEDNPSYIELKFQIDKCKKIVDNKDVDHSSIIEKIAKLKVNLDRNKESISYIEKEVANLTIAFTELCDSDTEASILGINKFNEQVKIKSLATIVQNFSPVNVGLENKKVELRNDIYRLQADYCRKYDCDLGTGYEDIDQYIKEHHKLESADIIKYEEDLRKAKENCELEFRESFLARLKENIENAKLEFKNLNSALKNIYYGEDSYKFELTYDKKKERIYQMITSENNEAGYNLWSKSFDDEYKEEMEDLFYKLTAYDDKGEKVLAEYTDYRCYLDYDIIVEKKDGTIQRFSKTYGEKSGGETQTPYYVAIAASFVQLYRLGDTIRIIMLDEAFDKMDDNRIEAMMDFFNSQNFQIILATPPTKIEIIGEKVDTVLMAMREGTTSIIEEYDL